MTHPITLPMHETPPYASSLEMSVKTGIGGPNASDLQAHRAPIPEEEPLPGEEPAPEDEPTPHPDPVVREPDDAPPLRLLGIPTNDLGMKNP